MISIIQIWENKVAAEAPIRPYLGINNKSSLRFKAAIKNITTDYASLLGKLQINTGNISKYSRQNPTGEFVKLLNGSIK